MCPQVARTSHLNQQVSVQKGILPSPLWKLLEMVPIDAVREFVYADKTVGRVRDIGVF
jgi:hypothetical protein